MLITNQDNSMIISQLSAGSEAPDSAKQYKDYDFANSSS